MVEFNPSIQMQIFTLALPFHASPRIKNCEMNRLKAFLHKSIISKR